MPRSAALAALLLALLIAPASALAEAGPRAADGQLWSATKVAQAYWAAPVRAADVRALADERGVAPCGELAASIAPVPAELAGSTEGVVQASKADGWSAIGSCAFALVPRYAAHSRGPRGWWTRLDLRNECDTVVHEAGHAIGLTHDDAGQFPVMAQGHYDEAIPRRCSAWAGRAMRAWRASR